MKLIDLSGKRFGHITVLGRAGSYVSPKGANTPKWKCKCDCGKVFEVVGASLRNGTTKSCGCHKWTFNDYEVKDGVAYINIDPYIVKVDESDLPLINMERWHVNKHNGYVYGNKTKRTMHRVLLHPSQNNVVDHINKDRCDNRRSNLREVDYSINGINSNLKPGKSGEYYITYQKKANYYSVYVDKKYRGGSKDINEAIAIRDKALIGSKARRFNFELHGMEANNGKDQ
jgi:hypothetical protein